MSDDSINEVRAKIQEFLRHGRKILEDVGVDPDRLTEDHAPGDRGVWYLRVDGDPVYRVIAVPDQDEGRDVIAFYGTFLAAAADHVGEEFLFGAGDPDEKPPVN